MTTAKIIGVDWGTTSLRSYAVSNTGEVLAAHSEPAGILNVVDGDYTGVLSRVLERLEDAGSATTPVVMSGMIGSRQGWVEAPYVACPANLGDVAAQMIEIDSGLPRRVLLVPGLTTRSAEGVPDVIRGEEAQVFGASAVLDLTDGQFVLPGTHSKWIRIKDSRIADFQTYMTGEAFAALKEHTILGRLMLEADPPAGDGGTPEGFERGVLASSAKGRPGHLLHQIFSARTLVLFGELSERDTAGFLSGLLIGAEIRAATQGTSDNNLTDGHQPIYIMAGSTLATLYAKAADVLGVQTRAVDAASIVRGHLALFVAADI